MSEPTIQELIEKLVPDAVLTALSRKPEKVKAVLINLINQYARAEGEITELRARVDDLEKDAGQFRGKTSKFAPISSLFINRLSAFDRSKKPHIQPVFPIPRPLTKRTHSGPYHPSTPCWHA